MSNDCPFEPGDQVVVYLRDSGGTNQEDSTERQAAEIERWCKANRVTITRRFVDEARTGRTVRKREQLLDMLEHFRGGGHERGVIIWNYERFARNTTHGKYYLAELEMLEKIVHSITDHIPQGPEKILFQAFKLYSAEQTSIKNSVDVTSGLRRLVEVHGGMPSNPPRGFKRSDPIQIGIHRNGAPRIIHKWIPDPEMVPLVRRAFEMRLHGATTPQIIKATGLYTSVSSFVTFFRNHLYFGELVFGDIVIPDYCEPIIDRDVWDEVQRVARRRSRPASNIDHPRRVVSSFILSGLIHCQECGAPMNGYSIKQWDYYVCSRRKIRHDCNSRRIPRAPIETEVMRILTERMLQLDTLLALQLEIQNAWASHSEENEQARRETDKRLTGVRARLRNIAKAIADHGHSNALLNQLTQLEIEEGDLRAALEALENIRQPVQYTPPQMTEIAAALKAELESHDQERKRATIRGMIARIVARRTDDQIVGVVYCNQVIGNVPPREHVSKTLLYQIAIPVRRHKAPLH